MVVVGGSKNPDFRIDMSKEDMINKINVLFKEYAREDLKKIEQEDKINY